MTDKKQWETGTDECDRLDEIKIERRSSACCGRWMRNFVLLVVCTLFLIDIVAAPTELPTPSEAALVDYTQKMEAFAQAEREYDVALERYNGALTTGDDITPHTDAYETARQRMVESATDASRANAYAASLLAENERSTLDTQRRNLDEIVSRRGRPPAVVSSTAEPPTPPPPLPRPPAVPPAPSEPAPSAAGARPPDITSLRQSAEQASAHVQFNTNLVQQGMNRVAQAQQALAAAQATQAGATTPEEKGRADIEVARATRALESTQSVLQIHRRELDGSIAAARTAQDALAAAEGRPAAPPPPEAPPSAAPVRTIGDYTIDAQGNVIRDGETVSLKDSFKFLREVNAQNRDTFDENQEAISTLAALDAQIAAAPEAQKRALQQQAEQILDQLEDETIGGRSIREIIIGAPTGTDPLSAVREAINNDFVFEQTASLRAVDALGQIPEEEGYFTGVGGAAADASKFRESFARDSVENARFNQRVLSMQIDARDERIDALEDRMEAIEDKPEDERTIEEKSLLAQLGQEWNRERAAQDDAQREIEEQNERERVAQQDASRELYSRQNLYGKTILFMSDLMRAYDEFSGLAQLGSLFIDDEELAKRKAEIDQAFCDTILLGGVQCWTSKICDGYIDSEPGGSALIARGPRGEAMGVVSLQAEKSLPIIRIEGGKTIEEFQYKVTYSLTNPLEKPMIYNVEFAGKDKTVRIFGEDKMIQEGGTDGRLGGDALIPPISTTDYGTVCLMWNPKITTFDGKQEGSFCVPISQYEGAATKPFGAPNVTGPLGPNAVALQNFRFSPNILNVNAGDTVTWTNQDDAVHTVTSADGPESFDSGDMQKGKTFSKKFTKAGTYNYKCSKHPTMTGTITVKETAAPSVPEAKPKKEDFGGF